jgi:hypothetical protein
MTTSIYLTSILLITIIVEWMIYCAFIRKKIMNLLLISVLINALTLPLATYAYYYIYTNLLFIEMVVVISESFLLLLLLQRKYSTSLLMSICANGATVLLSFLY